MADRHKPPKHRTAVSRHAGVLVVDGSDDTTGFTNPVATITKPATQVVPMGDYAVLRLIFGGTDAANETVNYQVIGWYELPRGDAAQGDLWVPHLLARGAFTLGASAITGVTNGKFADTITETLETTRRIINPSTPDDSIAELTIDTRNALLVTVETDRDTAAKAYVWAIPGEVTI